MERAYLLIAGILTGAAVGLLSTSFNCWLAAGTAMGVVLSLFARRPTPNQHDGNEELKARKEMQS